MLIGIYDILRRRTHPEISSPKDESVLRRTILDFMQIRIDHGWPKS